MAVGGVAQLYQDHQSWLTQWLYTKLGCSHQAADFTHDTFVKLLQKAQMQSNFVTSIEQPKAYLTTVAGNLVHDHFRRVSLEQAYLAALAHIPGTLMPSPEDLHCVRETLHEIDRLLDQLKPQVRDVFVMSQIEGLTYRTIAERLNISERTVKRYMARALTDCILLLN